MAAQRIRAAGSPFTGVYMYMLDGDNLELEAFDGRPTDHNTIPIGSGLCGRAMVEGRDLNIGDVNAQPEYLACSIETKAELIVLIRRGEELLGQIDIDSDRPGEFSADEQAQVKRIADGLASLL